MVEINNLTTNLADEDLLRKIATQVLKEEGKENSDLSIGLVGPGRMRKLNKTYLEENRATDVLAFGQNQKFPIPPKSNIFLGEIVICLRDVKKNAKRYTSSFKEELARVLIHGILHLLGYNHELSFPKTKEMEERERYYLEKLFS